MTESMLEHVNFTVTDPKATAETLARIFGWHIRWQGEALAGGYTVHVGSGTDYVALYTLGAPVASDIESYRQRGGLNHVGIVVDDLDATEQRVIDEGFQPENHAHYDPGRRFYFRDRDGIEFEVVSYA